MASNDPTQTRDEATSQGQGEKYVRPVDDDIENALPHDKEADAESLQLGRKVTIVDPVFGEIEEGGPNYRNVSTVMQYVRNDH